MHTDDFMQLLVSTVTAARGGNAEASSSSSRSHARRARRGRLLNKLLTKEPPASPMVDAHNPTTPIIHQPSTPTTPPGASQALLGTSLDSTGTAEISFETPTEEAAPEDEHHTESRNIKIVPRCGSVYNNHTFKPAISHSTPPGWPPTTHTNQRPPARELSPNSITRCKALSSHKITSDLTIGDVARVAAAELLGRRRTEYIFIHDHPYPAAEANMGPQRRTFRRHPRPPLQTIAPPARPSQPKVPPPAQPTQPRARKTTSTATVTDENPGFEPSPPRHKARKHTSPPPTPPAAPPAHPTRLKLAFGTPIKRD
jgi:hypothetical protein